MQRNGVVRLRFGVSGGGSIRFPGAAEPAGASGEFQCCEQAETSSPQPWHLLDPHQHGFVEGFLTAQPPFVLVCVLRLPENSVGYPTLPLMIFFFSLSQRQSISILSYGNLTRTSFQLPYLKWFPLCFLLLYCIHHGSSSFY